MDRKGFSLVELMIVGGAIAGLGLVVMNLNKSTLKSSTKYQYDSEINQITNELVSVLSTPTKCLSSLGGKNAISTTSGITNINSQYYIATDSHAPSGGYGNAGLKVDSYNLLATAAEIAANTGYLDIHFQNKNIIKGTSGPSTVSRRIKLYVEVDASDNITKCRSISSGVSDIWLRGSASDIYYGDGNVGIGTTAPQRKLDLDSDADTGIRIKSPDGYQSFIEFMKGSSQAGFIGMAINGGLFTGVTNGDMAVRSQSTPLHLGTNSSPAVSILVNNNVGIGTVNPPAQLSIVGAGQAPLAGNTNSYGLYLYHDTGPGISYIDSLTNGTSGSKLAFRTYDNGTYNTNLFLAHTGFVGVGTAAPADPFVVDTSRNVIATFQSSNPGSKAILVGNGNLANNAAYIAFYTAHNTAEFGLYGVAGGVSMNSSGNIGMGTQTPSEKLEVIGNIFTSGKFRSAMPGNSGAAGPVCYNGVTGYLDACSSLRKFKSNIKDLNVGLDLLNKLRPVTYTLNSTGESEMGFIAEEINAVDSRFGLLGTNRKLVGVKYDKITSLLTKAVQELFQIVKGIDHEKEQLKKENQEIKNYLCWKDPQAPFCR